MSRACCCWCKYKDGDANVRSVWLCSRNDAIGNVAVMIAAVGGLGDRDQVAGPDRRGDHGGAVPHVVGEDPQTGARRIAQRAGFQRVIARTSALRRTRGAGVGLFIAAAITTALALCGFAILLRQCATTGVPLALAFLIALPLQPLMIYARAPAARRPAADDVRHFRRLGDDRVAVLRAADRGAGQVAHRGGADGAARDPPATRSSLRSPPVSASASAKSGSWRMR